jgi:hypothetical protein
MKNLKKIREGESFAGHITKYNRGRNKDFYIYFGLVTCYLNFRAREIWFGMTHIQEEFETELRGLN